MFLSDFPAHSEWEDQEWLYLPQLAGKMLYVFLVVVLLMVYLNTKILLTGLLHNREAFLITVFFTWWHKSMSNALIDLKLEKETEEALVLVHWDLNQTSLPDF